VSVARAIMTIRVTRHDVVTAAILRDERYVALSNERSCG
jgi:hypothetical protein